MTGLQNTTFTALEQPNNRKRQLMTKDSKLYTPKTTTSTKQHQHATGHSHLRSPARRGHDATSWDAAG